MLRRILLVALAVCLAVIPATASGQPLKVNVVTLSGTTGLALVRLFETNPSLGRGVQVTYSVAKTPEVMVARVMSGEADIAALPTNTAAILYNKGVPIKLAAITNWGVMYLVGRDGALKTWSDLKGREIAVTNKGATPDLLFRYFLKANGINPDTDVRINYYASPVEVVQLMLAGRIELAALPEPWVSDATLQDSSIKVLLSYQDEWKRVEKRRQSYPQSCLVVSAKLAGEHPAVVGAFLKQAAACTAWVNSHPREAGLLAEKYISIPAAAAEKGLPRCTLQFSKARTLKTEIDFFLSKLYGFDPQSVGGKLPDADFYLTN